jgi:hypothetical protein
MSKRLLAIFLILLGVAGIGLIIFWIVQPLRTGTTTEQQPPPLPSTATPNVPRAPTSATKPAEPKADSPEFAEQKVTEEVKRTAKAAVERLGSYGNTDGFQSIRDSYTDVTAEVRTYLDGVRKQLNADHPASGGAWSQRLRVVTVSVVTPAPIRTSASVELTLDVQQTVSAASQKDLVSYARYGVKLDRTPSQWLVSRISSVPFQP